MLFFPTLVFLSLLSLALCVEDYYKLLGIDKQASEKDIKRAYRTLSKKYHPDKNPNDESAREKFVEIAEAYEALSSPDSRKIYDQYGHEGYKQHKNGGGQQQHHDPFDLFSRFFGGGGHFQQQHGGQRQGPDMEVRVHLPLRDFYNGNEQEFTVEKQAICDKCEGSGSADGVVETCTTCSGRGATVQKHMLAPGIYQQMQTVCGTCGGTGQMIKHACTVCSGSKVVRKQSTYQLHVERGVPRGGKVVYENEADESPDWVAGNLIVQLEEREPQLGTTEAGRDAGAPDEDTRTDGTFMRRKGRDLFWTETLGLREAWLGGWTRNLTHLDGHEVRLSRPRGSVVQPGTVEVVPGEGMPRWERDDGGEEEAGEPEFGALHVKYVVVLPDQMEGGMEKEFWALWDKWRRKIGVDLGRERREEVQREKKLGGKGKDEL